MNPPKPTRGIVLAASEEPPALSLRRIVRNSAQLNLVIVLTSCPVLISAGGMKAIYPTLAIMASISVIIWAATFALYSFAALPMIFRLPAPRPAHQELIFPAEENGLADPWLDGFPDHGEPNL
jgi:hypothetical protein